MTVMKLSDALRLADEMGLPQIKNAFIRRAAAQWGGEKPASCAMGGALIAAGLYRVEVEDGSWTGNVVDLALAIPSEWWENPNQLPCPACSDRGNDNLVPHLNDVHGYTRSQIADYLDAQAGA